MMYWTFILLVGLSATAAFQINPNLFGFGKRFLSAAIFGDSTSDTGNVYDLTNKTWPVSPPNFLGRYGNGLNWADNLKVLLKLNYAYGSATSDNNLVVGKAKNGLYVVPGLFQQVQQYLNDSIIPFLVENTVQILWGGANDAGVNPALLGAPTLIVNSLIKSVNALLAGGAKTIILFNQEPFQYIPGNVAVYPAAQLAYITNVINSLTKANLTAVAAANPQADIYLFDLYSLISNLYANPPAPVVNTTGYCWKVTGLTVSTPCSNPKEYFFSDTLHLGSVIQKKLAQAVDEFFKPGFIPSPANYFYAV